MINKSRYNFDQRLTDIAQRVLSFNGIIPQNLSEQLPPQRPTDFESYQQFNNPDYQAMKNANYATEPLYFYQNPQDRLTAKLSQAQAQYNLNQQLLGYTVNNSSNLNQIYLNPVNNVSYVPQYSQPAMINKPKLNKAKEIVKSLDVNNLQKIIEQEESLNLPSVRRSHGSSGGSRPTTKAGEIIAQQKQLNNNRNNEQLQEQQYKQQQIIQQQQAYEQQQLRLLEQMRQDQLQFQQQILAQQAYQEQAKLQRNREKQRDQQTAQVLEPLLKNQSDILSALTNKIKDREGTRKRGNNQENGTGNNSQMSRVFQDMMSENLRSLAQQQEKYNQDQLFSYRSGHHSQDNNSNNNSAMFTPMLFNPGGYPNPMMQQQSQQQQQLQSPMLQSGQPMPGMIGLPEKYQGMNRNSNNNNNQSSGQFGQNPMGMNGLKDMHSMMFANQKDPQDQVIQSILQDFKRG